MIKDIFEVTIKNNECYVGVALYQNNTKWLIVSTGYLSLTVELEKVYWLITNDQQVQLKVRYAANNEFTLRVSTDEYDEIYNNILYLQPEMMVLGVLNEDEEKNINEPRSTPAH